MTYYRTCPFCGAHLDPGEKCDCRNEKTARCANTERPAVEQSLPDTDSTSHDNGKGEDLQV